MPKRSKKSKSKRLTLKQKYKVIKKVKEHHRKKRRELKKSGNKPKEPKDPGIPSQWPFKEELLKELAWKRQQILMQEKAKKEDRKRAREGKTAGMDTEQGDLQQLAALQAAASDKQQDHEARKRAKLTTDGVSSKQGDADNSRRAYYKEFRRVVEASDVVIQVLDARDPAGCRCLDVERYVRSLDPNKRIILLLNKMDLVPREVGEAWLKHYRQELPAVAFKASTQQQADSLSRRSSSKGKKAAAAAAGSSSKSKAGAAASFAAGSGCLGADTLLQLLKNYARNAMGGKGSITVGVVGLPNVGKSSLINSLKHSRVAQVGSTPGVTKGVQEIHLDKQIRLLDSPGIVFSSGEGAAAAAMRNAVKIEKLEDPVLPVSEILKRVPQKQLLEVYKIGTFDGVDQFLQLIANARGKLKKGGIVDTEAAARIVLQDWNSGRIPYYTLPPKERPNQEFETAEVVNKWAAEFDAAKVFAGEAKAVLDHLPTMDAGTFFEVQSAGNVAAQLEDMEAEEVAGAAAAAAGGGAGSDAMDDDEYGAPSTSGRPSTKALGQNAGLYNELGQLNPKKVKAEQKRLKKARAAAAAGDEDEVGEDGDGSDFDFDVANAGVGLKEADSEGSMSGSDVASGSGEGEIDSEGEYGKLDSEGEDGDDSELVSDEYGADDDEEDVDKKYEDTMES